MVVRIAATKTSETLCYAGATFGALAPLYFLLPSGERRLASQTAKWAPRWERNLSYFTPTAEKSIKRVEPPVARAIRSVEGRLPLEKVAKGAERRIQAGFDRWNGKKP